ncbi:amino acid/amide ABC transporter ATP-binding protein 2 (HAAT family) [Breoghania corrubedonensis]|uniref:Amino acid/amide ABC transporter ATP-binding protein 2 (HAAT family) n=1 Tax=Breoghania corrubedonensis TaxID=665038 RepID=A0A2T5VB62_9HYPH|nr:ABC transporter ATP-binding protein [Breoghania corrubedonensis]PTW60988.1 amino acid/amide ABC transporter ATP-binding protein 2 (HAAT family) [Breoghania corrubedonensis]
MPDPLLEISGLVTSYGPIEVLHGIDLFVNEGEIVTLVGANGAGKTTLMRCISGVQPTKAGTIRYAGAPLARVPDHARAGLGIAHSPEGRQIFGDLSVEENLALGGYHRTDDLSPDMEDVFTLFPILKTKRHLAAGGLSGGQQQMLAIGRAIMGRPKLLLLDEPSMGLAPVLVDQILEVISTLRKRGVTLLVVEQNAYAALSIADRGYVMETGKIALSGSAGNLIADPRVREAYLGA